MSIIRIATNVADLTAFGGSKTTNSSWYANDRVEYAFFLDDGQVGTLDWQAASGNETWIHFVYAQNGNSGFNDAVTHVIRDASANTLGSVRIDGALWYFRIQGDVFLEGAPISIGINSPFVVDIQFIVNPGSDITMRGYIGSALIFDSTQANTAGRTNPTRIEFLNPYSGNFEHDKIFSEVIIADEDTRGFRLRELKPQAFGVFQQWDGTVASVVDDSLATGVSTDIADERVSFGLRNLDRINPGDIINRVIVQTYAQRGAAGLTAINHFFRYDDGTIEDSANIGLGVFGDWYIEEFLTNPRTTVAWQPIDFEGLQLGLRARA